MIAPRARPLLFGVALLPWVAALISCWPLLVSGFPRGHDWPFELVRVAEYQAALLSGQLPPAWAENLYGGYGSPVFLFYAPLFAAGASLCGWLLGSVAGGASACLILLTAISVWTARGMLSAAASAGAPGREAAPGAVSAARMGVCVLVLHPYLLGDKLLRNANSEFAALCLIPLVLWGVLCADSRPRRAFALLSGGLAFSILAHNLMALVAIGLALAAALIVYLSPRRPGVVWIVAGGIGFGLALAGFFWIPALALLTEVRSEELLQGKFDFHHQFKPLVSMFGYGEFFASGWLTPAALLFAVFAALRRRRPSARASRLLAGCLIAAFLFIFLLSPASSWLWETAPFLPLFQFPWRMAGPLALVAALASTLGATSLLSGASDRRRALAEVVVFALCVANAWPQLSRYAALSPEYRARPETWLAPETIRSGRQSVTVGDEYLPRGASPRVWLEERPRQGPIVAISDAADARIEEDRGTRMVFFVRSESGSRLRLARWSFPGWRMRLDGVPAEISSGTLGSIELEVPAGETRVELVYRPPRVRTIALVSSGLAFLLWIALLRFWPTRLPSPR